MRIFDKWFVLWRNTQNRVLNVTDWFNSKGDFSPLELTAQHIFFAPYERWLSSNFKKYDPTFCSRNIYNFLALIILFETGHCCGCFWAKISNIEAHHYIFNFSHPAWSKRAESGPGQTFWFWKSCCWWWKYFWLECYIFFAAEGLAGFGNRLLAPCWGAETENIIVGFDVEQIVYDVFKKYNPWLKESIFETGHWRLFLGKYLYCWWLPLCVRFQPPCME